MLREQVLENNGNLHASCSPMFQLQANIDKQLSQLHFHTSSWHASYSQGGATYKCHQWHSTGYMASTPSFDVYTGL